MSKHKSNTDTSLKTSIHHHYVIGKVSPDTTKGL